MTTTITSTDTTTITTEPRKICSLVGRVEWQAAILYPTNGGEYVDAWILSVNGRPILHAVALSEITEPVSVEDRKMIGHALAEYLANETSPSVDATEKAND